MSVGLVIIECVFGGWFSASNLNRLNRIRDRTLHLNVSRLYEAAEPVFKYSRDEYGLRGTYDKPSDIDILTVGGSTTDQRYIRDGKTWQDALQNRFAETGIDIVIANAGVDGQSTYGHILNFEWWFPYIPDLAPDYICFYIGLNDFYKDTGYSYDQLVHKKQNFNLKTEIKKNSAFWHMLRTLRGIYHARLLKNLGHQSIDFKQVQWTHDRIQNDYEFMEPRLNEYAGRLRALADLTRNLGAKPIFVSQPARKWRITTQGLTGDSTVSFYDDYEFNGVDYYHMMRKLDNVTKIIAREKDVLFVDLAGNPEWVDADFYDFYHMTPKGAEKVGFLLWNALKDIIKIAD